MGTETKEPSLCAECSVLHQEKEHVLYCTPDFTLQDKPNDMVLYKNEQEHTGNAMP